MTCTTRREFLGTLAFASVQSIVPASMQGTSSRKSSAAVLDKHDFEPVRDRILKEVAGGAATGVAVAVAHNGKAVWEEGFGCHRVETDGSGVRNSHNAESPETTWPEQQLLRHNCCAVFNGCGSIRSFEKPDHVLHDSDARVRRSIRQRSRSRAVCDV